MAHQCRGCPESFSTDLALYCHVVGNCENKVCPAAGCTGNADFRANPRQHMRTNHRDFGCASCCSRFFLQGAAQAHASSASHPPNIGDSHVKYTGFDQPENMPRLARRLQHQRDSALRPSAQDKQCEGELMKHIKDMVEKSEIHVANVFKSGSAKKGTAVRGVSDIDIVVYCNTKQSPGDFARTTKQQYLDRIAGMAKEGQFSWADKVEVVRQTNFHTELRIHKDGKIHKVDLLIATKSPVSDPANKPALYAFYDQMKGEKKMVREHLSAGFAEMQAKMVRELPPKVKNVIREIKQWKEEEAVPMKSYLVETMVMRNWEQLGGLHKFHRGDLKKMVFEDLANFENIRELWPDRYSAKSYQDKPFPAGPVVLDPTNPFNNLAPQDPQDIADIQRKARAALHPAS